MDKEKLKYDLAMQSATVMTLKDIFQGKVFYPPEVFPEKFFKRTNI